MLFTKEVKKTSLKLSRRHALKMAGTLAAGGLLAACAPPAAAPAAPAAKATKASTAAADAPTEAPAAAGSTGVSVSIMYGRGEFSEDEQKTFEKDSGIKVEQSEADPTKLIALFSAGTPPDVFRTQAPGIPQYLARKLLLDLTNYFQTSSLLKPDDLGPASSYYMANSPLDIGKGNIYGMPKDWSPDNTLYVNTRLFKEAGLPAPDDTKPMTYAELRTYAEKLTKKEGEKILQYGYGYEDSWQDRFFMVHLQEKGQSLYSDDFSQINLTKNPDLKEIAEYYYKLAADGIVRSPKYPSETWMGDEFTKDTSPIVQYGYWFSAMAEGDVNKGNVMLLPAPTWTGKRLDPTITATGTVISAATKHPEEAWKLFEYYSGGLPATTRAKSGWGVPALKSMYPLMPTGTPFQKQANAVLLNELQYANTPVRFNPYLTETAVTDSWKKNLTEALKGNITLDQLLDNVEVEINEAIKDGIDRV